MLNNNNIYVEISLFWEFVRFIYIDPEVAGVPQKFKKKKYTNVLSFYFNQNYKWETVSGGSTSHHQSGRHECLQGKLQY